MQRQTRLGFIHRTFPSSKRHGHLLVSRHVSRGQISQKHFPQCPLRRGLQEPAGSIWGTQCPPPLIISHHVERQFKDLSSRYHTPLLVFGLWIASCFVRPTTVVEPPLKREGWTRYYQKAPWSGTGWPREKNVDACEDYPLLCFGFVGKRSWAIIFIACLCITWISVPCERYIIWFNKVGENPFNVSLNDTTKRIFMNWCGRWKTEHGRWWWIPTSSANLHNHFTCGGRLLYHQLFVTWNHSRNFGHRGPVPDWPSLGSIDRGRHDPLFAVSSFPSRRWRCCVPRRCRHPCFQTPSTGARTPISPRIPSHVFHRASPRVSSGACTPHRGSSGLSPGGRASTPRGRPERGRRRGRPRRPQPPP